MTRFRTNLCRIFILLALLAAPACQPASLPAPRVTPAPATPTASFFPIPTLVESLPAPSPTAPPDPETAEFEVDPSSLRGRQLDFLHPWGGPTAARVEELVDEFNGSNPFGITVRARAALNAQALVDAVEDPQAFALPGFPEVVAAPSEVLAGWLAAGRLANLAPYLARPDFALPEGEQPADLAANYDPIFWDQDQSASGALRSGIPLIRTARVLFYNRAWAKELGFASPPATLDEFKTQACAAEQSLVTSPREEVRGTGGYLVDNSALTLLSFMRAFDAAPVPAADGSPYAFNTPQARAALDYLTALQAAGCAWVGKNPAPHDYFARRMALFYSGTFADIALQEGAFVRANAADEWALLPFPGVDGAPFALAGGDSAGMVTSTPEDQAAAWVFLRFLARPRSQALLGEVYPSLPLGPAAARELTDYSTRSPWSYILPLRDALAPAPALASWRLVRPVVSDAAWQVFILPADQVPLILPQLDDISKELVDRAAQP